MKPQVFYGLHMAPGVAEYREPGAKPYRILINEEAIKQMDPTFAGCPVYVNHVDEVDFSELQKNPPDGYVVESFFNQADGKHWTKFIVTSERGMEAIRKGWKLSNAYVVKNTRGGGLWHGVDYEKEVMSGEYEHLAIVSNPRYAESKILNPEEFKQYNADKEIELKRLANSDKGDGSMKLKFWKKQQVEKLENAADLESVSVELPKTKREVTIAELVKNADVEHKDCYANGEHKVKVGEEELTVNELVEKHLALKQKLDGADADAHEKEGEGEGELHENEEDAEAKKKAEELAAHEEKEIEKKKNELAAQEADLKKRQADFAKRRENLSKLKNAPASATTQAPTLELSADKVARGKNRYGSN